MAELPNDEQQQANEEQQKEKAFETKSTSDSGPDGNRTNESGEQIAESSSDGEFGVRIRTGNNQGKAEVIVVLGSKVSRGWLEEYRKRREAQKQNEAFDKPVPPEVM
jgi:hypothetical protein